MADGHAMLRLFDAHCHLQVIGSTQDIVALYSGILHAPTSVVKCALVGELTRLYDFVRTHALAAMLPR